MAVRLTRQVDIPTGLYSRVVAVVNHGRPEPVSLMVVNHYIEQLISEALIMRERNEAQIALDTYQQERVLQEYDA